jgi:DinB superfamily
MSSSTAAALVLLVCAPALAQEQRKPTTPAEVLSRNFADINRKVLEMAQDFPEAKYGYKLTPEMRSFGELIVHIASGNAFGAKAGRGEKTKWDELDPKNYKTKTEIAALMQKSIADSSAALQEFPEGYTKSMQPWVAIIEHSAEHYGLLVGYYRANGLVPPESRPKAK